MGLKLIHYPVDLFIERTTMRFLTLSTLTILAGGLLAAADSANVTYIDGNVAELSANTGATLYLTSSQSMELKTPLHKVQIPYAQISKAEVGSVMVHTADPGKEHHKAAEYVDAIPHKTWATYAFPQPRYGHLTSNIVDL